MATIDLYSRRAAEAQGVDDGLRYDTPPSALTEQVIHIWRRASRVTLNQHTLAQEPNATLWAKVAATLAEEHGTSAIAPGARGFAACSAYLRGLKGVKYLDVIEVSFRSLLEPSNIHASQERDQTIADLNTRFSQNRFGYLSLIHISEPTRPY